jgi:hypothetical protein
MRPQRKQMTAREIRIIALRNIVAIGESAMDAECWLGETRISDESPDGDYSEKEQLALQEAAREIFNSLTRRANRLSRTNIKRQRT